MNICPIASYITITPLEEPPQGQVIIPDTAKTFPRYGRVLAVGPGRWVKGKREDMNVIPGDTVIFRSFHPDECKIDGEHVYIIQMEDVIARL